MNKKGFTLIELLSVIIILAVIALIATPVVLNVVENAKKEANKNSVYGLIDAARMYYADSMLNSEKQQNTNGTTNLINKITVTGNKPKPDKGEIYINNNGEIALAVIYDDICYTKKFTDNDITESEDITSCTIQKESLMQVIKKAVENMEKLDSYYLKFNAVGKYENEQYSYFVYADINKNIDNENKKYALSFTLSSTLNSVPQFEMTTKEYYSMEGSDETKYFQEENVWYKKTSVKNSNKINFSVLLNATNIEKTQENIYKLTLTEKEIDEFYILDETLENIENHTIYVTIENEYITNIKYEESVVTLDEQDAMVSYTNDFSNFNNIIVEIPEDIVLNAVENNN